MRLIILLSFLLIQCTAYSQQVYGYLSGTVKNADTETVIHFASIKIVDADKKIIRTVSSDRAGKFMIRGIPKGEYTLEIDQIGAYKTLIIEHFSIPQKEKLALFLEPIAQVEFTGEPKLIIFDTIEVYTKSQQHLRIQNTYP